MTATSRLLVALLAIMLVPASRAGELSAADAAALKDAAGKLFQAFEDEKPEVIMEGTHPSLFKQMGGRDKFEKITRESFASFKKMGVVVKDRQTGEPTRTYQAGDEEVCFLPSTTTIVIGEQTVKSTGFLIAIRKRPDGRWLFLDGSAIRDNKEMLRMMLPELPEDVELPPSRMEPLAK